MLDTVAQVRRALAGSVPLIGFSGSPFTLACYMVEGGASSDFRHIKTMLYDRPELLHRILEVNARAVTRLSQRPDRSRRAGRHDLRHLGRLADGRGVPGVFARLHAAACSTASRASATASACRTSCSPKAAARGSKTWPRAAATPSASTGRVDIGAARARVGDRVALQGNLDPAVLLRRRRAHTQRRGGRARAITAAAAATCSIWVTAFRSYTPPENVAALVEAVHELSRPYH